MGLTVNDIRLLVETRRRFPRALTLGRQWVFATPKELREIGVVPSSTFRFGGYFDESGIPEALGTVSIVAADASAYEGATLIHDFNSPLPAVHLGQYDLVIDGGTLEHVFNVTGAIANCMRALRVGGTYFGAHPANNLMGHGFYQFGPEFYYRAFARANGFRVEILELQESRYPAVEHGFVRPRYSVRDPETTGDRISLQSSRAAMLRVVAVKTDTRPLFTEWPQQTDYVPQWSSQNAIVAESRVRAFALRVFPRWLIRHIIGWRHRHRASLANRAHFHVRPSQTRQSQPNSR